MPEVNPEGVPRPIAIIGWDGTRYNVIGIDNAFHVQVDVIASALAAGAATAANQVLMNANLILIAELRDALQSVDTDRLIVRGEDQLFSFKERIAEQVSLTVHAGGNQNLEIGPVPANEVWIITSMLAIDETSAITAIRMGMQTAAGLMVARRAETVPMLTPVEWSGHAYAENPDTVRARFYGTAVNDTLVFWIIGYVMTKE